MRERQGGHWPWGIGLGSEGSSCYVGGHEGSSCYVGGQQGWIRLSALVSGCLCEISCTGFQLAKLGSCRAQAHTAEFRTKAKFERFGELLVTLHSRATITTQDCPVTG